MKKIVLFAFLINTTASYCWQWSDLVPSRLQNWYQNWKIERKIRQQEIQKYKALENQYLELHEKDSKRLKKNPKFLWQATKEQNIEMAKYYNKAAKDAHVARDLTSSEKRQFVEEFKRDAQRSIDNVKLLDKYSPYKKSPSSIELRDKSMRKRVQQGWGY
ncbi:MAG TPA: hypothetical protein VKU36_03895 [Candidatus Babeliales bacterium]|nr:hypothetical protein [Candidatus Babeliales bacterium]